MNGTAMVDGKVQFGKEYLGSSGKKWQFVQTLHSTAVFLFEQKRIPVLSTNNEIQKFYRSIISKEAFLTHIEHLITGGKS